MASCPRRSNANNHPAQVLLNATQKRCTSAQVQADKAIQEMAAATATAAKITAHEEQVKRVANFEDKLCTEDEQNKLHAARPDLRRAPTSTAVKKQVSLTFLYSKHLLTHIPKGHSKAAFKPTTVTASAPAETQSSLIKVLDDTNMEVEHSLKVEPSEYEDLLDYTDLPLESVLDSESSDGLAVGNGSDCSDDEKEVDCDYMMNEDELSNREVERLFVALSAQRAKKKVSKQ
jgi:hypothetical protein